MRISDWSSDVCSSDLLNQQDDRNLARFEMAVSEFAEVMECYLMTGEADYQLRVLVSSLGAFEEFLRHKLTKVEGVAQVTTRPEEHTSELQSLIRISYAIFCLKKKKNTHVSHLTQG